MQKYCRQCGTLLPEGARFCRRCGAATGDLEISPTSQLGTGAPPTGTPSSPLTRSELPTEVLTSPTQTAGQVTPKRNYLLLAVVLGVILLIGGVGIGTLLGYRLFTGADSPRSGPELGRTATPPPSVSQQVSPPQTRAEETPVEREPRPRGTKPPPKPPDARPPTPPKPPAAKPPAPETPPSALPPRQPVPMRPGSLRAAAFLQQGREHLNAGRYRLALAEFRKVKRLDPGNQDVNYLSGLCLEQMGQLELALEAYRLCESGPYASVAKDHARRLARKLGK